MELKWVDVAYLDAALEVLIVPLWNWNVEIEPFSEVGTSSNRTFMELKFMFLNSSGSPPLCSNRTFMELK